MANARLPALARLPLLVLAVIIAGAAAGALGASDAQRFWIWMAGLVATGAPVAWRTLRGMLRGEFAADVVAMLAIVGAVGLGQPLAGLVVVLMQTGGEALDAYAVRRASDAVRALEADAPRVAHRLSGGGADAEADAETAAAVVDIGADDIEPGDRLLVRPGELVPCDGAVEAGSSHVDTSRLTGEPLPVRAVAGTPLLSGSINGEGAIVLRATRRSSESQYARIVELVRSAQASKSPLQRVADRWAVWFTPLTLAVCAAAWWLSGDLTRVLAVLVVATPCPLILAAPVAIIGGINRAARRSIIVRNGSALEALARVRVAVFDKTGTLTIGQPRVAGVTPAPGASADEALALAAAVEHGSGHLLARVIVAEAESRGLRVGVGGALRERPGQGVQGTVGGAAVAVGSLGFVREAMPSSRDALDGLEATATGLRAYVATSTGTAARIDFADELRADLAGVFADLARLGVTRHIMLSGDRAANVASIAAAVGITEFAGDLQAEDKVTRVRALEAEGLPVLMVGDGTNDAPALSAATVGVALAGHGGGVTAEAADIVLLVDEPGRVAEAIRIARRTMRVARQSIGVGLGLSLVGMMFAAAGYLQPVAGALVQEAIDVAVILNALRASRAGGASGGARTD